MRSLYSLLAVLFLFGSCQSTSEEITPTISLEELTITKIHTAYEDGTFTITGLVQAYLDRIATIDQAGPQLNSILELNPDVIEIAKKLDAEWADGNIRGPLHGIPVVLKDNIDTHDKMSTTAGSRVMAGSKPLQDSWVAAKLRESGAVILGKANLSEWANFHSSFSSSGWSSLGGQTKNPYNPSCNPCGSSAGSGVAVSANLCVIAIGTETNGSIVCPSNNNGIVGIKPTVGLISRSGIIPISFTQDTPGPMGRTVEDAAICLGALTGIDPTDSKTDVSAGRSYTDYTQFLNSDGLNGKRIGLYKKPMGKHFLVDSVMNRAVEFIKSQGASVVEIEAISKRDIEGPSFQVLLYEFKDGINKYFASLGAEAPVSSLADLIKQTLNDSISMEFFDHQLLKEAQEKGDLQSKEYLDALDTMLYHSQANGIDRIMDEYDLDAIMAPTGAPAWKTDLVNGDNFGLYSSSPAAISGYPNITVPMGYVHDLPVGISFFGRAWSEPVLIEIAYAYEQGTMHRQRPKF